MDNLQSILFSVGSAIGTVSVILGIGRFLGKKESVIDRLEKLETPRENEKVAHLDIECHRKINCPYGHEFEFLRTSISDLKKDVGELNGKVEGLNGKVEGVKSTIEFIGEFIKNGRPVH